MQSSQKHSGLGIAAFVISMVSSLLLFILIIAAGVLEQTTPGGMDENSLEALLIGLSLFVFLGTSFLSLILGIIALFQKERNTLFAILATVFSSLALLGTFAIMAIGLMLS